MYGADSNTIEPLGASLPTETLLRFLPMDIRQLAKRARRSVETERPHDATLPLRAVLNAMPCSTAIRNQLRGLGADSVPTARSLVHQIVSERDPTRRVRTIQELRTLFDRTIEALRWLDGVEVDVFTQRSVASCVDQLPGTSVRLVRGPHELLVGPYDHSAPLHVQLFAHKPYQGRLKPELAAKLWKATGRSVDVEGACEYALLTAMMRCWAEDITVWQPTASALMATVQSLCPRAAKLNVQCWLSVVCADTALLAALAVPLVKTDGGLMIQQWNEMERSIVDGLEWWSTQSVESVESVEAGPCKVVDAPRGAGMCAVCLEAQEGPVVRLPCGHTFHPACFQQWCQRSQTCPLCRAAAHFAAPPEFASVESTVDAAAAEWARRRPGRALAPEQRAAAIVCATEGLATLTGAAGTGKTEIATVMGLRARMLADQSGHGRFIGRSVFVAPTGKAASNLQERLDPAAFTVMSVHAWLLCHYGSSQGAVPQLYVDEASMLDLWTTYFLLREARRRCVLRLVFIGDPMQLPPVRNYGSVLHALGSRFNVALRTNFRTGVEGLLALLSHLRSEGSVPRSLFATPQTRLLTVPNGDPRAMLSTLRSVLPSDPHQVRVLSATRRSSPLLNPECAAKANLLHERRAILRYFNPLRTQTSLDQRWYKGDPVMATVNVALNLGAGSARTMVVANGTEAVVQSVRYDQGGHLDSMLLRFENGSTLHFPSLAWQGGVKEAPGRSERVQARIRKLFRTLDLACCNTVHKFQGSQRHTIVVILTGDWAKFLTLELLYTAVSRARNQLVVLMEEKTASYFEHRPGRVQHNDRFASRLQARGL